MGLKNKDFGVLIIVAVVVVVAFLLFRPTPYAVVSLIQNSDCSFITNAPDEQYSSGTWISVDRAGDGQLEGYGYSSTTSRSSPYPDSELITTTPAGHGVYKCGTSVDVCLMLNKGTSGYKFKSTVSPAEEAALTCCVEDWSCGVWGSCVGGVQTRTCTDLNSCGTTDDKPAESQLCSSTAFICDADDDGKISWDEFVSTAQKWLGGN